MKSLEIEINSGIVIADPCYSLSEWCVIKLDNVLRGKWICSEPEKINEVSTSLVMKHELCPKDAEFDKFVGWICVDSGQAGFFDMEYYAKNLSGIETDEKKNPGNAYSKVCKITLNRPCWGALDNSCVVSKSGYGDGIYEVFGITDKKGDIIGLKINFD